MTSRWHLTKVTTAAEKSTLKVGQKLYFLPARLTDMPLCHCKSLQFWFPCNQRYTSVGGF